MIGAGCFFENKHCTKLADECEVKLISKAPLASWLEILSLCDLKSSSLRWVWG